VRCVGWCAERGVRWVSGTDVSSTIGANAHAHGRWCVGGQSDCRQQLIRAGAGLPFSVLGKILQKRLLGGLIHVRGGPAAASQVCAGIDSARTREHTCPSASPEEELVWLLTCTVLAVGDHLPEAPGVLAASFIRFPARTVVRQTFDGAFPLAERARATGAGLGGHA
jgi:hypothetical protein